LCATRTTPPRMPPRVGWGRWASAPRSSVHWAVAVHIRFARWRGVRLAGRLRVPVPVTIGLGRDQRRCTHERENAIEICRSPEDVFDYLTRHHQGGRVEPEDQAGREAHAGPDRPRHPVRCGVDQGQPGNRRVCPVRAAGGVGVHHSFPAPGCEGRGADPAGGTGLPSHGQNQTPAQGIARPAVAVDAANGARARR
jgi:hypothetical protein